MVMRARNEEWATSGMIEIGLVRPEEGECVMGLKAEVDFKMKARV